MLSHLLRSTPFRVAVVLGAAFLFALLIAGLIAFELIGHELDRRMDRSITDSFNVISEAYGDSDQVDLVDSIQSHVRATVNHDQVFALAAEGGKIIAGNVTNFPAAIGWSNVLASALGVPAPDGAEYRVFVGVVGGARLLAGSSFVESREIASLTLTTLAWAGAVILVVIVAIGIVMATRAQRRIDGIAQTMARVGHGELGARIALGRRGDDIDLLARQVNDALDRLVALVEGLRQVSVNIAHDLKTPLNRLAITVESLLNSDEAGQPMGPLLEQAQAEIQQINVTFDALLRIAQIEAGARKARFVPVQIGEVLDKIADVYGEVAEENKQRLQVNHTDLPRIEGDRDLLTQLCANIVENSIRHAGPGTTITITAEAQGDRVVVTFSDDGAGIPVDEHERVFQRLYRIEKSRTTPGNGLGLSLVKAVAELHNAQLKIGDNAPGLWIAVGFPHRDASRLTNL